MNWKISVPKLCHIYWGGNELNYLRYLSVVTFMKYNPDWQVVVHYPVKSFKGKSWGAEHGYLPLNPKLCKDYFPKLMDLPIIKNPINFTELGFGWNMSEVHKADYVRINVLYLYGGLWTDLDVLYFKPVTELKVNIPQNKDKEIYVCISPEYGHSTGFNMALPGSGFLSELMKHFDEEYNGKYQCWGPDMFNKYFNTLDKIPNSVNIGMEAVYAHDCFHVTELLSTNKPRFIEGSVGCHWYAGHSMWGEFFNRTHGGEINLPDNIIGNLIRDAK